MIHVRTLLAAVAISGLSVMAFMVSPPAHADTNSYEIRLANAGYTGPISTWLNIGYDVCGMEANGVPASLIASKIVVTTGVGIYTADAYEIINIANAELCQGASQGQDGSYAT